MSRIKLFEDFLQEMSLSDWRVQKILNHMKTADENEVQRCKQITTGKEDCNTRTLLKALLDCDYSEIKEFVLLIFGPENSED